jgi:hypothetical protein
VRIPSIIAAGVEGHQPMKTLLAAIAVAIAMLFA